MFRSTKDIIMLSYVNTQVVGQQGVTGFRQTAFSELCVSVSELKDQVEFTCIAVLADRRENASLLLTAYCE